MPAKKSGHITISRGMFISCLLLAALLGSGLSWLLIPKQTPTQPEQLSLPEPAVIPEQKETAKTVTKKPAPVTDKKAKATKKPDKATGKAETNPGQFVIKGLISTAGEPWSTQLIRVRLLWLKNKGKQSFLLGQENAQVQMIEQGLAYQFVLQPQTPGFISFNSGVEGNIARIIVFIDQQGDGQLTPEKDRIIAVSRELVRYRSGRFDNNVLSKEQIAHLAKAGKGYAIVRQEEDASGKIDWRVVADTSPIRLDLDASETKLPGMYNTFLKLR